MTAAAGQPLAAPAVGPVTAALAMALLMGLQPATTDIYLPALPALTRELAAPMTLAQMTMSALILAFGLGQLVWGPVADRAGRRPVLLASLTLYALASAASTLADSIHTLVLWRTLQGFAMAGAVVCSRAMVRDLYPPQEGARVMALALSGLGVVAIGGPVLGGLLTAWAGWRAALAAVAVYGALALLFVVWRLPETLAQKNPQATQLRPMLANWRQISRNPTFIAWTLLATCTYGGIFTYLAGSSFVFIDLLGLSPGTYGLVMGSVSLSYLGATFVCRRWIAVRGTAGTVARGAWFTFAGGLLMLAAAFDQPQAPPSLWLLLAAQWLYAFGHGFHMPCGQAGTVSPFPRNAGAASALAGFVLALVAFGIGRWLGVAMDGTARPFALTVAFWAGATSLVGWTLVRWHGRPTVA